MRGTVSLPFQYGPGSLLQCTAPLRTARALYFNARRRTASVPLGPSITCAALPRRRFGTAWALCTTRYRHPVCVLQSFNWVGVKNFQENTKTKRNPRNATLTLQSRRFFKRGASTTLNKGLGMGLARCIQRKIAFSGEFVAFILVSKNTSKTGLATEGLPTRFIRGLAPHF